MKTLSIIILAAGKGKRMLSPLPKVLQLLSGRPLLDYVIKTGLSISPGKIVVVIGHKGELVKEKFRDTDVVFVVQKEQLGTGHATAQAETCLDSLCEDVLILSGDVPMIKSETLLDLLKTHSQTKTVISFFSTILPNPSGYGRVVRNQSGKVIGIVEDKDADEKTKFIREINSGIYCIKKEFLFSALKNVNCDNEQKEYYLTDVVKDAVEKKLSVEAMKVPDWHEVMGINTRDDLLKMEKLIS